MLSAEATNKHINEQLTELNRQILEFCYKVTPPSHNFNTGFVFPALQNHLALLDVINSNIHQFIFLPFHPGIELPESDDLLAAHDKQFLDDPFSGVWKARCRVFASLEVGASEERKRRLIDKVFQLILLQSPPVSKYGTSDKKMHPSFHSLFWASVEGAYDWNVVAQTGAAQTVLRVIYPKIPLKFDEDKFKLYSGDGVSRSPMANGEEIVAVVSMGLEARTCDGTTLTVRPVVLLSPE